MQNAVEVAAQGVLEQFSVDLQNYAPSDGMGGGGSLPPIPEGHVPILWIDVLDEMDPTVYDVLFSGIVLTVTGADASWTGKTTLTCATPIKPLKRHLHSIVFFPDAYPTDTSRIRGLGIKLEGQLPDWDFTTFVADDDDGNITYPLPKHPNPNDGTSGDEYTEYVEATAEEIIRAIATDPGYFVDVNYPVQARDWWIEGNFITPGDPTSGVKWYVHYINVTEPPVDVFDLMDSPDPLITSDFALYSQGSSYEIDYASTIRMIHISGPTSGLTGESLQPMAIEWLEPGIPKCGHKPGAVYKRGGVDGDWDAGARSARIGWTDFEVTCQCQELYLEHDTFQRADNPYMGASNHGGVWSGLPDALADSHTQPMSIKNGLAVPQYEADMHLAIIECYASTCNLRTHIARNRMGARLLFRWVDQYNYWYLESNGSTGYTLYKYEGAVATSMGVAAGDCHDMQEIKVSMRNSDVQNIIEVYVDDEFAFSVDDDFQWDSSLHGIGVNCDLDPTAKEAAFYDFQCTHFWGDKAFGIGDNIHPLSWVDILFAFVFNSDGTLDVALSGDPTDPTVDWEPGMQFENDYTYNDRFKVLTVQYMDPATRSLQRQVQFLKQPGGQGDWLLLYRLAPVPVPPYPVLSPSSPWFANFAAKERGAALANTMYGMAYSNIFFAPNTLSTLYGSPYMYPATGLLQSDQLDNYVKRQRVADAIFKADGEPAVRFTGEAMTKVSRGTFARITSRRAGWTNPLGGPDKRKVLKCKSVQRVETGNLARPRYRMLFGEYYYASDDPGRTHLLRPFEKFKYPLNRELPTFDGMGLTWPEHVITGSEYGQRIEIQMVPYDQNEWSNQQWPTYTYDADVTNAQIPASMLPPKGKFTVRQRTVGPSGASAWSESVPFASPAQPPSERTSMAQWYLGDGNNVLSDVYPDNTYDEIQINQPCSIVAWAFSLYGVEGDVTADIQWCTAKDRRANGVSAFQSITGTGPKPFVAFTVPYLINDGTYNDDFRLRDWSDLSRDLRTGDFLRLVLTSADTAATKGMLSLTLQPNAVPFAQTEQPTGTEGGTVGSVDSDGRVLVDTDGEQLTNP